MANLNLSQDVATKTEIRNKTLFLKWPNLIPYTKLYSFFVAVLLLISTLWFLPFAVCATIILSSISF